MTHPVTLRNDAHDKVDQHIADQRDGEDHAEGRGRDLGVQRTYKSQHDREPRGKPDADHDQSGGRNGVVDPQVQQNTPNQQDKE